MSMDSYPATVPWVAMVIGQMLIQKLVSTSEPGFKDHMLHPKKKAPSVSSQPNFFIRLIVTAIW